MLNDDLKKVNDWIFQLKMNFYPDPNEQAQEAISQKYNIRKNVNSDFSIVASYAQSCNNIF